MGLFDAPGRSIIRDEGDIYREKADRLAEEARQLYISGRLVDAEERVRELIGFQTKVVGERHPEYATGLCMLAEILSAKDELSDAETLIQRALEIRKKATGEHHPDYASGLDQMGRLMLRWEDHAAAEPLLLRALEIRRETLGGDHPDYAESLAAFAELVLRRDDHDEAERLLRLAIDVQTRAQGGDHPDVARILSQLSEVLQRKGWLEDALIPLRQAVEILRLAYGEIHPEHRAALSALAGLLQKKGDFNAAEPIWRLLLDMIHLNRDCGASECAEIESKLGQLLQRKGDFKGAELQFRQAMESCKNASGERHPEYVIHVTNLAHLLQRAEDLQGAETLYRQALAVRKEVLGVRHPDYATSLFNLAQLVQRRGDATWARMLLKEAIEIRRSVLGEEHADYAQGLAALADVHAQQGDLTRAEALLRQALDIRRGVHGERHTVYAANLSSLAGVLRRMGDLDGAESLLRQALQIRKATTGEEHPDYATNLGNLAWLLQRKGDRVGADTLLSRALQIRLDLLGEGHPDYQQSLERLKSLRAGGAVTSVVVSTGRESTVSPRIRETQGSDEHTSNQNACTVAHSSHEATGSVQLAPAGLGPDSLGVSVDRPDVPSNGRPVNPNANAFLAPAEAVPGDGPDGGVSVSFALLVPGMQEIIDAVDDTLAEAEGGLSFRGFGQIDATDRNGELANLNHETAIERYGRPDVGLDRGPHDSGVAGLMNGTEVDSFADDPDDPRVAPTDYNETTLIPTAEEPVDNPSVVSAAERTEDAKLARGHSMSMTSSHLSQELAGMSDRFSELGERLLTFARQLHAPGILPPENVAETIDECRRDFQSLRSRTLELAGSLLVTFPPPESLNGLQDLTALLDHIAEAEIHQSKSEEQRQRALSVLDRVLTLRHVSSSDFAPLSDCQNKARELREEIAQTDWNRLPAEAERLAEGQHQFADLLSFIEDHDDLQDDHWATLHDNVGESFGKALAAAAARSKLVLPETLANHH